MSSLTKDDAVSKKRMAKSKIKFMLIVSFNSRGYQDRMASLRLNS